MLWARNCEPFFVFGAVMTNVSLYHGDCLELLKDVPSKSVNMVLCDLPYGTTCNKWDSCINLDALWIEYKRVLAEGGGGCLVCSNALRSNVI